MLINFHIRACLLSLIFALAPHYQRISPLLLIFCLATWSYAWLQESKNLPQLNKNWRTLLTIIGLIILGISHPKLMTRNTFVSLLVVLAGLKVIEIANQRDKVICVFLSYFLILTCLLYENSLLMSLYLFTAVLISSTVLSAINYLELDLKPVFKFCLKIMAISLPFMLILFIGFPRSKGNHFGFSDSERGTTGFSNTLSPGSITKLSASDAIAFRVSFFGKVPATEERYFRGIVFYNFDGTNWHRGVQVPENKTQTISGKEELTYNIMLEPHGEQWLFALDYPKTAPNRIFSFIDQTLFSKEKINEKFLYSLTSVMKPEIRDFPILKKRSLQLPREKNPKTFALVKTWKDKQLSPKQIVDAAYEILAKNDFVYSDSPLPLDKPDSIDQFLFETKIGFCEHFASAFAVMLRSAGVPARIVGGYHGGEYNAIGNYLLVKQVDAHTWVEVWLEEEGWVRIDPTTAVAPNRISQGAQLGFIEEKAAKEGRKQRTFLETLFRKILFTWDATNFYWNNTVMGYTRTEQKEFLSKIGINYSSKKLLIFTFSLVLIIASILLIPFFRKIYLVSTNDKILFYYLKFIQKMSRLGIHKPGSMGARAFAKEVEDKFPDLKTKTDQITELYLQGRYGKKRERELSKELENLVREL